MSVQLNETSPWASGVAGTDGFMAPEIILNQQYDQKVDVWSLGILCWEMCEGRVPFPDLSDKEVISFSLFFFFSKYSLFCDFCDLLRIILQMEEEMASKDSMPMLSEDEWSENCRDFAAQCLEKDPHKRISVDDLLKVIYLSLSLLFYFLVVIER